MKNIRKTLTLLLVLVLLLGVFPITAFGTDLTNFEVIPGAANDVDWSTVWVNLRGGEIWTDKSVYYPQIEDPNNPSQFIYEGTVIITIYVWGKPYQIRDSAGNLTGEEVLLGDDHGVSITAHTGDFALDEVKYSPDDTGVIFTQVNETLHWVIPEARITDSTEPFQIRYYLYLEDRVDWLTNFMYSTKDSRITVEFEPHSENMFYWTTQEITENAFDAINMSWNAGNGLNSGAIIDRELGITINFGPNRSPSGQTAQSVPWATYQNTYWAQNARVYAFGPTGTPVNYWWHLQWVKGGPYVFTVHELTVDVDGLPLDVVYEITLGGPGGNEAIPGNRTITSTHTFRRTFEEGNPSNRFPWDEKGHLVYTMDTIASITLIYEPINYYSSLTISKDLPPDGWQHLDWNVNDFTTFHARVRIADGPYYLVLNEVGGNEFVFDSFAGRPELATTITFSQRRIDPNTGLSIPGHATITGLPVHMSVIEPGNSDYIVYEAYEFFDEFFIEFFGDYHDQVFLDNAIALAKSLIDVTYSLDAGVTFTADVPDFALTEDEPTEVLIRNYFNHGIGFLEVHKLLDGFPNDWDVDYDTTFYIRIWDVEAQNYLLFDYGRTFAPDSPFYGTIWCIGNHVVGFTESDPVDGLMDVRMEIPISRNSPVKLSNLWTWGAYQVVEVRRAGTDLPQDTTNPHLDPSWVAFWNNPANRIPFYLRDAAQWATWEANRTALQDRIDNEWEAIRIIEDDNDWHDDKDWNWGVIYSPNNEPGWVQYLLDANGMPILDSGGNRIVVNDNILSFNETIIVGITNRFDFHSGTLELVKEVCENAVAWGITPDTRFYAQVLTDNEPEPRALVFVPDVINVGTSDEREVWRVIGFMGINPATGLADEAYGYQVLCPVGEAIPPDNAQTTIAFSVSNPTLLVDVPSSPFGSEIVYMIQEVFPDGEPFGFINNEFEITGDQDFVTTIDPIVSFPHQSERTATITNNFYDPTGNLVIYKALAGDYSGWNVNENTLFFAGVYREGVRRNFYTPEAGIYVYENYPHRATYLGTHDGAAVNEVSFSAGSPAVVIGLTTNEHLYPAEHPYEVVELRVTATRFAAEVGDIVQDGDNLFVTITNRFVNAPEPGNGNGGEPPPPPQPPPPPPTENDTEPNVNDFFTDYHIWFIRGYPDNTIRPDNNITRAEVAMVFFRLLRPEKQAIPAANLQSPFTDVRGDEWYALAISVLAYHGIFVGYEDGSFRPNAPITRREFATAVSRFDTKITTDTNPFLDVHAGDWAHDYILSATAKGWFIGFEGQFRPGDNLTRAELVTVVNRMLNRSILPEHLPEDILRFPDLPETHWAFAALKEAIHTHDYVRHEEGDGINERWLQITGHGLDAPYNR